MVAGVPEWTKGLGLGPSGLVPSGVRIPSPAYEVHNRIGLAWEINKIKRDSIECWGFLALRSIWKRSRRNI